MDLEDKIQISGVTTTLIYLYVVPAKVAGRWNAQMPPAVSRQPATLRLRQQLTRVSGSVVLDGEEVPLEDVRSEEHTSELQSPCNLVCRLLLEKKKKTKNDTLVR